MNDDVIDVTVNSSEYVTGAEAVKMQAQGLFEKIFNPISNMMSEMGKGIANFASNAKEKVEDVINPAASNMTVDVSATEVAAEGGALAKPLNILEAGKETAQNTAQGIGGTLKDNVGKHLQNVGEFLNHHKDRAVETWDNLPPEGKIATAAAATLATVGTGLFIANRNKGKESAALPAQEESKWANRIRAEQAAMAQQQGAAMAY